MKATIENYFFEFFKIFWAYLFLVWIYLWALWFLLGFYIFFLIIADFDKKLAVYVEILWSLLNKEFHMSLFFLSLILVVLYIVYKFYQIYKYWIRTSDIEVSNEKVVNKLNDQLKVLDIWWKKITYFTFSDWKTIKIQSINLAKIVYQVIEKYKKNTFWKNELIDDYNYFKNNYKTSLDEETYNKVLSIIKRFVDEWWTIKVI